jgi:hypothetical protein
VFGHELQKDDLTRQAKNNSDSSVGVAISRLLKSNEKRATGTSGELAIAPKGQKHVDRENRPEAEVVSHVAKERGSRTVRKVWLSAWNTGRRDFPARHRKKNMLFFLAARMAS